MNVKAQVEVGRLFAGKQMIRLGVLLASTSWLAPLMAEEGHGGGHEAAPHGVPGWVWMHAVNLVILLVILFKAVKAPLRAFLLKRHYSIRESLEKAEAGRLQAEKQLAELTTRLQALDAELTALKRESREAAEKEAQHMIERAQASAARIQSDAKKMLNEELARGRAQLQADAAQLAIEMATDLLKRNINEGDQQRLAAGYLDQLSSRMEMN